MSAGGPIVNEGFLVKILPSERCELCGSWSVINFNMVIIWVICGETFSTALPTRLISVAALFRCYLLLLLLRPLLRLLSHVSALPSSNQS